MKKKYIDSIRGVAILMVILVHSSQSIANLNLGLKVLSVYGQMGVQLFFLASAYTLCLSSTNRINESNPIKKYTIRRFFRIAPAYYIGIFIYFLLSAFQNLRIYNELKPDSQYSILNIFTNITFIHGFYPPANNNIVPGGWSIGTEIAFYIIFPLLYKISTRKKLYKIKFFIFWVFLSLIFSQATIFLVYFFTNFTLTNTNYFLYLNIITQLPVFCIGIGYYFIEAKLKRTNFTVDFLIFLLITLISIFFYWKINIEHFKSFVPFISGISFIFLFKIFRNNEILNHPILMKIGKLSYSMYLIHFVFAWHLKLLFLDKLTKLFDPNFLLVLVFLCSVLCSFLVSLLSHKYIEKPFINIGRLIIKKMN